MIDSKLTFLGVETPRKPKISILPVPLEKTVSYGKGTSLAPAAIIKASCQVELYDEELEIEPYNVGIELLDPVKCENRSIEEVLSEVEMKTVDLINDHKVPFIIGGEHSITPSVVDGLLRKSQDFTVVQLDAHADLRSEYEGTKYSHASALFRIREKLPAIQVGIRSLSKEEAALIKKNNWYVYFAHLIHDNNKWVDEVISKIETDKIYITLDVDVFDSGILPQTGTPEPGGLGWYQVLNFLRCLMIKKEVIGMDVVELAPVKNQHSADFMIAKLIYKMIGYWFTSQK